jgi:hypothetical protein
VDFTLVRHGSNFLKKPNYNSKRPKMAAFLHYLYVKWTVGRFCPISMAWFLTSKYVRRARLDSWWTNQKRRDTEITENLLALWKNTLIAVHPWLHQSMHGWEWSKTCYSNIRGSSPVPKIRPHQPSPSKKRISRTILHLTTPAAY